MNKRRDILLALDPGDTTGVAAWDLSGDFYEVEDPEILTLLSPGVGRDMLDPFSTNPSLIPTLLTHIHKNDIDEFLMWVSSTYNIRHLAVEDFVLFKRKAVQQAGSRMATSQIIGKAKFLAKSEGAKIRMFTSDKAPIAAKHAGIDYDKMRRMDHRTTHKYYAFSYGMEYMIQEGLMPSSLLLDRKYNG